MNEAEGRLPTPERREMSEAKKTKSIAFRLTDEEYAQVERAALAAGEDPNAWCRKLALTESRAGYGLTKDERLIYEEVARVRFLLGHGFRLLAHGGLGPEAWERLTAQADQKGEQIADALLSRRQ